MWLIVISMLEKHISQTRRELGELLDTSCRLELLFDPPYNSTGSFELRGEQSGSPGTAKGEGEKSGLRVTGPTEMTNHTIP